MTGTTSFLDLITYSATTDSSALFLDFRTDVAGSVAASNMSLIDNFADATNGSIIYSGSRINYNTGSIVAIQTAGSAQDTLISWNSGSISANGSLIGYHTGSIVAIQTAGSAQDTLISWNSGSISASGSLIGYNSASIVALQAAAVVSGSQIATLADVDGSAIDLLTGTTGITGFIVNGYVTGSNINNFKVVNSGSNLLITSASPGYIVSVNDVYNWIVF